MSDDARRRPDDDNPFKGTPFEQIFRLGGPACRRPGGRACPTSPR